MDSVLSVIGSVLIVTLFACLFCAIGKEILDKTGETAAHRCFTFAASYFTGMAVYLSALRTLTLAIPYKIAFWVLLVVAVLYAVLKRRRVYLKRITENAVLIAVMAGIWIAHTFHALLYRLTDVSRELTPYDGIGTIGSLRYAGIADYFIGRNRIPVLNQSYGQSLLASFSGLLGSRNLCFALTLWLALSGAFLCLLLYGVFRKYFSVWLSTSLTCVVHMGSVSLTFAPIRVVDSDYPLISSGYTDSVVGVATLFIYLWLLVQLLRDNRKVGFPHCLLTVCFVLYWAMSAPHNICILLGTGAFLILFLLFGKDYISAGKGVKLGGVILAACLLGIFEGGMLTPSGLAEEIPVEGVMTVAGVDEEKPSEGIAIVPVMNYQLSREPGVLWGLAQNTPYMKETLDCAVRAFQNSEWYVLLYCLTALWWDSVRIIFWPLLGVLGIMMASYWHKESKETGYWAVMGFSSLAIGYPIAFFISLNAYKWALSRFAMPFYFLGMLFLAVILGRGWKSGKGLYRLASLCSVFFILSGQVLDKILIFYGNCANNDIWSLMKGMVLLAGS